MTDLIEISKVDIATEQLYTAIQFYLDKSNLISAITLAGAAEEILGNLVKQQGKSNAFEFILDILCYIHKAISKGEANRKEYANARNRIKNEFKHLCSGGSLEVNLDKEAGELIDRAIKNYQRLFPGVYPRFNEFNREWLKRHT
jgi:hypothetical protein